MKEVNDFYDFLDKDGAIMRTSKDNPPVIKTYQKIYTMGHRIDFPMLMSYKNTENPFFKPYFYFLNGYNDVVYFADANFTQDEIKTYEYNPWGILLAQANKNNLLYTLREFDFETGL